ncbi:GNAT family N-acetyltransferase [Candidatus Saccharibacteria bacterium]|nr:GNAT family N-acetyltransferase [Candidatus Saccharibacteria bacterium]
MNSIVYGDVVRPANYDDYEWAINLLSRAMGPFYDCDYRARTRRLFDQCVGDNKIAGHYLAVADLNLRPTGLVHVVERKNSILSIGLLAVSEEHRGKGVGGKLLSFVEGHARDNFLRFIHCTVASANNIALRFLNANRFSVIDTISKRHHGQVVDETIVGKMTDEED